MRTSWMALYIHCYYVHFLVRDLLLATAIYNISDEILDAQALIVSIKADYLQSTSFLCPFHIANFSLM